MYTQYTEEDIVNYIRDNKITHWVNSIGGSRSVWFRRQIEKNPKTLTHNKTQKYSATPMNLSAHCRPLNVPSTGIFCFRSDVRNMLGSQISRNIHIGNFHKLSYPFNFEFSFEKWLELVHDRIISWSQAAPIDVWLINTDKILDNKRLLQQHFGVSFDSFRSSSRNHMPEELVSYQYKVDQINALLSSLPSFQFIPKTNNNY